MLMHSNLLLYTAAYCSQLYQICYESSRAETPKVRVHMSGPLIMFTMSCRKRKLLDRSIPSGIASYPAFAIDSRMYHDLVEMEKKLDWTMTRKKAEVQDAMGRPASVCTHLCCYRALC